MPELPEVETTRRGLLPLIVGRSITGVTVRHRGLRWPVPRALAEKVTGRRVAGIARRGKYLLLDCGRGTLIVHLGMSGSLRVAPRDAVPGPWDHFDLELGDEVVRLRDPRRFGAVLWHEGDPASHRLLRRLGVEPLSDGFTAAFLHAATRRRQADIKQVLMNAAIVVGVGNIYASESLFRAGIRPDTPASRLSLERCARLVDAVKATLARAIETGGSTLRDFFAVDGKRGYFQQEYFAYGREGEPCRQCGAKIRRIAQGGRSTFYCPRCQRR